MDTSLIPFAFEFATSPSRGVVVLIRIVLAALHVHEVLLASIVVPSVVVVLIATPHALWIVRGCVLAKAGLAAVVDGCTAVHGLTSVDAAPFCVS